ncbi:hypothetical protein ACG02S_00030 [Roseateles sp. DC23W]|uniref:Uncharacterized protein n=1 Tax=Pelomonas dachongensis TaxID=3299029 RepID=A0ABW7EFM1_9BURK
MAGALDIDTSRIGQIDGLPLVDAMRSLEQAAGQPVALMIGEAQPTLTSEAGIGTASIVRSAAIETG